MIEPDPDPNDDANAADQAKAAPDAAGGNGKPAKADPPASPLENPRDKITRDLALAAALRPLEGPTTDLFDDSADKTKARDALVADYAKAVADDGPIGAKFRNADADFVRAVNEMADQLPDWVERNLAKGGQLRPLLEERSALADRLRQVMGKNEGARVAATAAAKSWADAYAAWSTPTTKIAALLNSYADRINILSGTINTKDQADRSIFAFWFDVAPKHLQLRTQALPAGVLAAIKLLKDELQPDLAASLDLGKDRDDGSLYLVEYQGIEAQREAVLARWRQAAEALANAEADFKLKPDDAATLRQRADKIGGDAWLKEADAIIPQAMA